MRRVPLLLTLAVVALALVLPVGAMIWRSFQVNEIVLQGGQTLRAVGDVDVQQTPDGPRYLFAMQRRAGGEKIQQTLDGEHVVAVRRVFGLDHYRRLVEEERTWGLLKNSFVLALGAAFFSILLGLPVGWLLARTDLPGRRLLAVLCLGPAILPPLIVAMGGSRAIENVFHGLFGLVGGTLQLATGMAIFGLVLFPLVAFLTGRALAEVPVGPWEAARQLGGHRAAFRHVVLPAVLPALFGAAMLVFVLAWSDFAVPDYLGVTLRQGTTPVHVFPTEILLQWKQEGNAGRAVATGAPYMVMAVVLLLLAAFFLGKSPVVGGGEGRRGRPLRVLGPRARVAGLLFVGLVLAVSFVLPLAGIASWGLGAGEVQAGTTAPRPTYAHLFDLRGAFERTPGLEQDLSRWLKSGLGAAILAMLLAVVLVRWARRSGRLAKFTVLVLGILPLAVPGLVLTVGTSLLWIHLDIGWVDRTVLRSVLVLAARFLPFALVATWLALRQVRPGHEEAAALSGAGAWERALRIWGPLSFRGLLGGTLLILVLALREIDAVILVDARILPLRLYSKIHFTRLADEATLCFLYVGILLVPALLATLLLGRRRKRP